MDNQIVCKFCCVDRSAEEIVFNEQGVCNFCIQAQKALKEIELEKPNLSKWIERIKKDGKNKKYSCLMGLSGGCDSSTTLHYAIKMGLKPLCFSFNNKWNISESDNNIKNLVEKLGVDHIEYTIDDAKYRELQNAFIKSGVPNIEIPTDHIILATSLELAKKYKIRWILSGGNVSEESVMPPSFGYQSRDLVHIKDIYKKFTGKKLTGLPTCSLLQWNIYKWWYRIKFFYLLDYLDYKSKEAKKMLADLYDWQDYGLKHEENYFTKWFQNFYLYEKFGFDKRKAHFSSLINSGQMTRSEAMQLLETAPVYPKLGIEDKVMKYPKHSHYDYKTDEKLYNTICKVIRFIKRCQLFGK